MIVDTHCHFDMFPNPEQLIRECEEKKIITIGMTNLPSHFQLGINRIKNYKFIRLAIGLHPLLAEQHAAELINFKNNIDNTSYIGEVGLDLSKEGIATKETQIKSFRYVLSLAADKKKIFSLHSRRAEKEVLVFLQEYKIKNAIFHWYSGSVKILHDILASGYYFSINTSMISSLSGKKIISEIPITRLLTETDGPYVQYKGASSRPENVKIVLQYLSDFYKIPIPEMENQIYKNFTNITTSIK